MSVEIKNISKSYSNGLILDQITFNLAPTTLNLLLGANGAGKSTLLKICAGLIQADQGQVFFNHNRHNLSQIGYLGHESLLYAHLSIFENLKLIVDLMGLSLSLNDYLATWNLLNISHYKVSELSRGQTMRVALARCFIHKPKYVFLDEPSTALDHPSFELLSGFLSNYLKIHNATILLATHDLKRLSPLANRLIVLKNSKVHLDSSQAQQDGVAYYLEANF